MRLKRAELTDAVEWPLRRKPRLIVAPRATMSRVPPCWERASKCVSDGAARALDCAPARHRNGITSRDRYPS